MNLARACLAHIRVFGSLGLTCFEFKNKHTDNSNTNVHKNRDNLMLFTGEGEGSEVGATLGLGLRCFAQVYMRFYSWVGVQDPASLV